MITETDCRSEVGITVGIVDSMITMMRLIKNRSFESEEVAEALRDLLADEDFGDFLSRGQKRADKSTPR